jgi:hypothetical protein
MYSFVQFCTVLKLNLKRKYNTFANTFEGHQNIYYLIFNILLFFYSSLSYYMIRESEDQRVLNNVQRTRLSCGCMIWLLPHTPPSPEASCLSFSDFLCVAIQAY